MRGLRAWRPAVWKVFPFPTALLSSCVLLSTTQVTSMASLSSDVQDEFAPRALKLREGRNAVGVFIPLLSCYEVSLGWLKVTASLQVALSSQLSLEVRYDHAHPAPSGVGWSCSCWHLCEVSLSSPSQIVLFPVGTLCCGDNTNLSRHSSYSDAVRVCSSHRWLLLLLGNSADLVSAFTARCTFFSRVADRTWFVLSKALIFLFKQKWVLVK